MHAVDAIMHARGNVYANLEWREHSCYRLGPEIKQIKLFNYFIKTKNTKESQKKTFIESAINSVDRYISLSQVEYLIKLVERFI